NQLEGGKRQDGEGVDERAEETTLDPRDDCRAECAEPQPVDRLEAGPLEDGFELIEGIAVADVPTHLVSCHPGPVGVALPVAVGSRDVHEAVVFQEAVNLTQRLMSIHDMLNHVEQEHLVVAALVVEIGRELVEAPEAETQLSLRKSEEGPHLLAVPLL